MKTDANIPYKYYLEESELPTAWYNVRADMKNKPAPLLNPGTLKPMTAKELDGVFCDELVQQELDDTTAYILSQLYHDGLMEATSVEQTSVFEAAEQFARIEGILPAPESSHAIRVAIDEALKFKETGEAKTIVFGLTGTGYFDMVAYEKFHNGEMTDYIPTDAELEASFAQLPQVPGQE